MTAGPARPDGTAGPGNDTEAGSDRPHSNDLALELFRQQTLLQVLTARLREVAAAIERIGRVDAARLRRTLDVHHRYVVEVHEADDERLARALLARKVDAAAPLVATARAGRPAALDFEHAAEAFLDPATAAAPEGPGRLARLLAVEADRIDQHLAWEADRLHAHLEAWLPRPARSRLLAQIRRFDAARVDAEIALVSWASQIHPSAD
jgi:hypothetical protein